MWTLIDKVEISLPGMKKVSILFLFLLLCPAFVSAADRVEINTASLQQLDEITGIGPVLAQRIIDARPFSSVDDLLDVSGIGPITLQKIKEQGLAFVSGQTSISNSQFLISNENQNSSDQNPNDENATETEIQKSVLIYPSGVFINEILPNPKGADETEE